jgi:hypothetical protein
MELSRRRIQGMILRKSGDTTVINQGSEGGGYVPPAGGIPKEDLSAGVQASLDKADTALQTEAQFLASPAYGITTSDISSWNSKQNALVSGTNIKTINNQSLLGSGNINIIPTFSIDSNGHLIVTY